MFSKFGNMNLNQKKKKNPKDKITHTQTEKVL